MSPRPSARLAADSAQTLHDQTIELQKRLAEEASERDTARMALQHFQRTVAYYRQELMTATSAAKDATDANCVQHVQDLVKQLEAEVRGSPENTGVTRAIVPDRSVQGSPSRSYEVLRASLEGTQRRCESLNNDMLQQSEANVELTETLVNVKDMNKELLEQIRVQSSEIEQLTLQRVADEERMDLMTRQHRDDQDRIRKDAQRKASNVREAEEDRKTAMIQRLTEKQRYLRSRLDVACRDVAQLREDQQRVRTDAEALSEAVQGHLGALLRDILRRCDVISSNHTGQVLGIEDALGDLDMQLTTEGELRASESVSWSRRHFVAGTELEDQQACLDRESSNLTSQLQAVERLLACERRAWTEERSRLEAQNDENMQKRSDQRDSLDKQQAEVIRLETAVGAIESEVQTKYQSVDELRHQIRQTDDELYAIVFSNEQLRAALEDQKRWMQKRNESDLETTRGDLETKLADGQKVHEQDLSIAANQMQAMEQEVRGSIEAYQSLSSQVETTGAVCLSLQREVDQLRLQQQSLHTARRSVETEFGEARKNFAAERVEFQAGNETLRLRLVGEEEEIFRITEKISELRRVAAAKEAENETRAKAAELQVRENQESLADMQRRQQEVLATRDRIHGEHVAEKHQVTEAQAALTHDLESATLHASRERQRMNDALFAEQRNTEMTKEQLSIERSSSLDALRLCQEENRTRLGAAERERARIEESRRQDISDANATVTQRQNRLEVLERDLSKTRDLLRQSEGNKLWVRQETEREEREGSIVHLHFQDEVRLANNALENASREDRLITQQIEVLGQRNERERQKLTKEMDTVREVTAVRVVDVPQPEVRVQRAQSEREVQSRSPMPQQRPAERAPVSARISSAVTTTDVDRYQREGTVLRDLVEEEAKASSALVKAHERITGHARSELDTLERGGQQLRSYVEQENRATTGLLRLHDRLEQQIQRLQAHTDELRVDSMQLVNASPPRALRAPSVITSAAPTPPRSPQNRNSLNGGLAASSSTSIVGGVAMPAGWRLGSNSPGSAARGLSPGRVL